MRFANAARGRISRTPGIQVTAKSVLTPADFNYLGVLKVPLTTFNETGVDMRFAFGCGANITSRRVAGELHLIVGTYQAQPVELVYDTPTTIALAPRLAVYKYWRDVFGSRTNIHNSNGIVLFGFHFNEEDNAFYWSFGPYYSGDWERSIGATVFNGTSSFTSYGPWRTTCHSKQSNGPFLRIPASQRSNFGGKNMMVMGVGTPVGQLSTACFSLNAFSTANLLSTAPSDYDDFSQTTINTQAVLSSDSAVGFMNRDPTFRVCMKGTTGNGYDCALGPTTISEPGTTVQGLETGLGGSWIDNTTKHGIVLQCGMVDRVADAAFRAANYNGDEYPHQWYAGTGNCCHGHTGHWAGHGPHVASYVPQMWIYDPALLAQAYAGTITGLQVANSPSTKHKHLYDFSTDFPYHQDSIFGCGGGCYDPVDRLYFVLDHYQDTSQFEALPLIHVFQVAA